LFRPTAPTHPHASTPPQSRAVASEMTRGNQRDLAREKRLKKEASQKKAPEGTATKRKERDADIMRQKQEAAAKKREEEQQKK